METDWQTDNAVIMMVVHHVALRRFRYVAQRWLSTRHVTHAFKTDALHVMCLLRVRYAQLRRLLRKRTCCIVDRLRLVYSFAVHFLDFYDFVNTWFPVLQQWRRGSDVIHCRRRVNREIYNGERVTQSGNRFVLCAAGYNLVVFRRFMTILHKRHPL